MGRHSDLHEQLKDLVRPALVPYRAKAALAKKMGVAQSYINQWMDENRQNPGLDKLPAIAEFLGGDFFVHQTDGLTFRVRTSDQKLPSQDHNGDGTDGVTADLRQQLKERDEKIHALHLALRAHVKQIREATDHIGALVGAPRHDVRKAARGKSKTS